MKLNLSGLLLTAAVAASAFVIPARVDAQRAAVPRPATVEADQTPLDATGRCRDGSFTTVSDVVAGCAAHRGVLVTFPVRQSPPRPVAVADGPAATQASVAGAPARPAASAPPPAPAANPEETAPAALSVTPPPARGAEPVVRGGAEPVTVPRPRGARGQCKDGTYFLGSPEGSCASNGGIAVTFPAPPAPPPAARQRPESLGGG